MKICVGMLITFGLTAIFTLNAGTIASQALARPEASSPGSLSVGSMFGEQIDTRTGSTQFSITDVAVKTNSGLLMSIGRKLVVNQQRLELSSMSWYDNWGGVQYGIEPSKEILGNHWELDVPYMQATYDARVGWVSASAPNTLNSTQKRCSAGFAPPNVMGLYPFYASTFKPKDYWSGISINIPGAGSETLLSIATGAPVPANGITYKGSTTSGWRISCLSTIKNGKPGEGFIALLPDGTKYYFDWMATKRKPSIVSGGSLGLDAGSWSSSDTESPRVILPLVNAYLFATRVEDRFGNWVEYDYDPANPLRLQSIRSNDGALIQVNYGTGGQISTITTEGRTWAYSYAAAQYGATGQLIRVTQPDGSDWQYTNVSALAMLFQDKDPDVIKLMKDCVITISNMSSAKTPDAGDAVSITMKSPSGAQGVFKFREIVHGTNRTPGSCTREQVWSYGNPPSYYWATNLKGAPLLNRIASIYEKQVTGSGLGTLSWSYSYFPSWSYLSQCPNATSCPSTSRTDVTDPEGTINRYTYGNDYATNAARLLQVVVEKSGITHRTQTNTYAQSNTGQPFMDSFGTDPQELSNPLQVKNRPLVSTATIQDGVAFNQSVSLFDAFVRPVTQVLSSSLGYSKTELTEFHDNVSNWVLGQPSKFTVGGVVTSETAYDTNALPSVEKSFGKITKSTTYYANGTLATVRDGNNNVTTLGDWYRGVPRQVTNPDGTTQSAVVNPSGWVTAFTDENGYITGYGYDPMGRLAAVVYPTGDTVAWNNWNSYFRPLADADWKPAGVVTGQWHRVEWKGAARKITYFDAMWRPIIQHVYDTANTATTLSSTRTAYDAGGRVSFQSYPSSELIAPSQGVWTNYDALGRVTSTSQDSELGLLTTLTEHLAGFQTRTTNPRGYQTTTQYQAFDQPSTDSPTGITMSEGAATEIHRDLLGRPTSIKRRNTNGSLQVTRSYVYDGFGQLCKTIEPETGATVMDYDAAGNLAWSAVGHHDLPSTTDCNKDAGYWWGRRVDRTYDARNRISALVFPDGRGNQSWTYTADGLPRQIITYNDPGNGAPVVNVYDYNKRRMLVGESSTQTGWYGWGLGYGYDANGSLSTQTYPTTFTISYAPNALGQATQAGTYATGVQYYPNGAIKQFTYGNGIVHTMAQNARKLPTRSLDSGGVLDHEYAYDGNANVTVIADRIQGGGDGSYSRWMNYDGLDRLMAAGSCSFGGDCWHRFTYDALDNMTSWKLPGVKDYANYSYEPGTNRLGLIQNSAGAGIVGFGYDAQGNLANKNGQLYTFDFGNRLRGTTGLEWYRYDGLGRRVLNWRWAESGVLSQYSQSGQLMYDENYRASGRKTSTYIYLAGSLVATNEWNFDAGTVATKYQHTDALGSPVAVTNAAGAVIERTSYEPYGAAINKTVDGVGYTGHVMDAATGLTYMQQRYYDPTIGRFLSVDPVTANSGTGANFNRYWYGNNNPYKFTDPDGRAVTVRIERDTYTDNSITSTISVSSDVVSDTFDGFTLEDRNAGPLGDKDPIAAGTYDAFERGDGNKGFRLELEDVDNFSNIQIHVGNDTDDVMGCFAAGETRSEDFVGGSRSAMDSIQGIVDADGSGSISIEVSGSANPIPAPIPFDSAFPGVQFP